MRTLLLACSLLLALSCPPLLGQESQTKPVVVIALAPVDDLLADVDYLSKVFGAEDSGKMVRQFAGPLLGGIDRKRPWGAYVTLAGGEMKAVGFIPVKSLQTQLSILEEQIGKPEKLPGGVLKVQLPAGITDDENGRRDLFLKEEGGWAFYSDKAENLSTLPKNPVALLGGLEKKYDFGTRFVVENIPNEDRQKFIDQIKQSFNEQRLGANTDAGQVPEEWVRSVEEALLRYAEGTKSIDFGLTIDAKQANVAISLAVEPIAGSELAKSLASAQALTTPHSGVLVPGSAVIMQRAAKFDKKDIALWDVFFDQIMKEMKPEDIPEEKRAIAAEGIPLISRVLKAGHADGRVDWGTSYVINDDGKLTTVAGMHVADLKKLAADMQALFEKYKTTDPDLAKMEFKWNFAMHGKVRIIAVTPPVDPAHNSNLLGDDPSIYAGIDGDYLYVVSGFDALKHLKEAIDRSAAKPSFKSAPFRMRIDVRPLAILGASTFGGEDAVVEQLTAKLEAAKGKTLVNVNLLPGQAGLEGRLEVGEGVLRIMPEVGQLIWQGFMKFTQPMLEVPGEEAAAIPAP
jgi:hypothetical protein